MLRNRIHSYSTEFFFCLKLKRLEATTHEGFCSRSKLQDHFARVSTHEGALFAPGVCSQVFSRLNIVEHFVGWKFCSRGWSMPMKSLVHTEELCSRSVPVPSCLPAFTLWQHLLHQKLSLSVYSKSTYDSLVWLGFFDLSKLFKKYRTAGHLVFWKSWPVTGHIAAAFIIFQTNSLLF